MPDVKQGFLMFSLHCLTKYSGISTKPAENLPLNF
jgi:hypothetical protein